MLVAFLASSCPFLRLLRFFAADPVWRTAGRRRIPEWRSLWGGLVKVLGVAQLVWRGWKRGFRALPGRDSRGASQDHQRGVRVRGQALHGEKGGNAGDGSKTGPVLGCYWPETPAPWETGRAGSERQPGGETAAGHAAIPCGEHAAGKAEIYTQEPTVVARFYGQAVLQRRVLA